VIKWDNNPLTYKEWAEEVRLRKKGIVVVIGLSCMHHAAVVIADALASVLCSTLYV
jgi:hypothetical protein